MNEFSQKTIEALKHYVYCLVDPRDKKAFYVGKGQGNRAFQHAHAALETAMESDKLDLIRTIVDSGNTVSTYIIRHGLDDKQAFEVESAIIDLLSNREFTFSYTLTNLVSGHHALDHGLASCDAVEDAYSAEPLDLGDIIENVIIININKQYHPNSLSKLGRTGADLYEATRKAWKMSLTRARKAKYVLATYRGIVRAVYQNLRWEEWKDIPGRIAFTGEAASNSSYLHRELTGIRKGAQNPIRYNYK